MPSITIGYLEQEPKLDPEKTVRETVEEGLTRARRRAQTPRRSLRGVRRTRRRFRSARRRAGEARGGPLRRRAPTTSSSSSRSPPTRCACRPGTRRSRTLSGGEKRRVALCRLLLSKPDMLLLDEPTNHLDAESVEWLEQFLARFPGTVVAVTHDRYFLDNAAEWILELDRGRGIPWKGNYSSWLEQKQAAARAAKKPRNRRAGKRSSASSSGCARASKAARTKNKSRIARFEELSSYEYQRRNETQEIFIPVARAARRPGHRVRRRAQGVRRPAADGGRQLHRSGRRDRRHHRPQRRRENDALSA